MPFSRIFFGRIERLGSERNNFANHGVLAIRRNVETAELLPLRIRQNHVDLRQTRHRRRFDDGNLPTHLRLIAKGLLHERVDGGFRRKSEAALEAGLSATFVSGGFAVARGLSCGQTARHE